MLNGFIKDTLVMCFGKNGDNLYVPISKITSDHLVFCWDINDREFKLCRSNVIKHQKQIISKIKINNVSFFCSNNQRIAYYNSVPDVADYDYIDNMVERQIITEHDAIYKDYKDKLLVEDVCKDTIIDDLYTLENEYGSFFIINNDTNLLVEGMVLNDCRNKQFIGQLRQCENY